ncbi:MAG: hypothetical protein LBD10_00800 [Desulfobulbus sp.]|jgi:hypothetical protein|uniref:hypothetical protein n=1 Tax=Desulfobulbus sp. TaxID=895 RepID=UPI00284D4C4D|nr:hypothetical protein [Desulfobulbus sp.]MDR2548738.1 hypothetical protein [Desulfobulbus sp.]
MKHSIFVTPRRGLLGSKPMGADYMPDVAERARRLAIASEIRESKPSVATDNRQKRLPGF